MILIKDGIQRQITNEENIKIFKEAGWEEVIKEQIKEQPKKKKTK